MNFDGATICLFGHVISDSTAHAEKYCSRCGHEAFSECTNCGAPIRGQSRQTGVIASKEEYRKPYYCYQCAFPYPWTSYIINTAVELAALDSIGEENKRIIKEALPDLIVETPKTSIAIAKYEKGVSSAGTFVKDALRQLLVDVVCEVAKQALF